MTGRDEADAARDGAAARVLFIRSMPLARDSRSQKMVADYQRRGFHVVRLIWTRGDPAPDDEEVIAFTRAGRYGARFGNLVSYVFWHLFIAWTIFRRRRSIDIIHVVDFDTAVVGVPMGRLFGKRIVYDAFDHFASNFPKGSRRNRFVARFERWLIRRADIAIFPDPVRLVQYGLEGLGHACIIGNIPDEEGMPAIADRPPPSDGPLIFAYVGTLEAQTRGLEYIPRLCADHPGRVAFVVGGLGQLDDYFREQAARLDNLDYVGPQPYAAAMQLMAGAHALYGPYLLNCPAHLYASPNKMYEHLLLGRPLVTSTGTPPAAFVEANGTGFLFDGSYESLARLVATLDAAACAERGARARRLWVDQYSELRARQVAACFAALQAKLRPEAAA